MKKHNEGYALVLVLVVITVLCLVAMAMMAASLKNLQNQQSSIQRMEAKYEAQGEIEKVVANLNTKISEEGNTASVAGFNQTMINGICQNTAVSGELTYKTLAEADPYLLLTLKTSSFDVNVQCTIRITGTITKNSENYDISNPKWEYVSYTITEGGGAG